MGQHGNNLRRCATRALLRQPGALKARGGHLPRLSSDADRKRDERLQQALRVHVCILVDHRHCASLTTVPPTKTSDGAQGSVLT